MTESDLQTAVIDLARWLGYRVAHFRAVLVCRRDGSTYHETPVAADGKGWPDLVLVGDRVLYVELKAGRNRLEPEQEAWRDALEAAGAEHHVWRPEDYQAGIVEDVLTGRTR